MRVELTNRIVLVFAIFIYFVTTVVCGAESSLLGWWKFDEASGNTATDYSGNGYTATVGAGLDGVWDSQGGHDGGCLVFEGNYGVIIPPELFAGVHDEVSLSVWVNGDPAAQPGNPDVIFHGGYGSIGRVLLAHCPWIDGYVVFHAGNGTGGSGSYDVNAYQAAPDDYEGKWNHYVFVKDAIAGIQEIYLNGKRIAQNTSAFHPLGGIESGSFAIGSYRGGSSSGGYKGKLDDFRIYNRKLSAEEIDTIYNGEGNPFARATNPVPADGANQVKRNQTLSWSGGVDVDKYDVYIGTDLTSLQDADISSILYKGRQSLTAFDASLLDFDRTYYWRIDSVNESGTVIAKGDIWSFTTNQGTITCLAPQDNAENVAVNAELLWASEDIPDSYDIYIGNDYDAVLNATTSSREWKANQSVRVFKPDNLESGKTYHWRIDQVWDDDITGPGKGPVWRFATKCCAPDEYSLWSNVKDYTYMWWADGLRDGSKVFNIQTSRYGLSFDFDDFELKKLAPILGAPTEEEALVQDNSVVQGLADAALKCIIESRGERYRAISAGPYQQDCMIVESGKFFHREWIENISFSQGSPKAEANLEISAWPDRVSFTLHVTPESTIENGAIEVDIDIADIYSTLLDDGDAFALATGTTGSGYIFLTDNQQAQITCNQSNTSCKVRLETGSQWNGGTEKSVCIIVYPVGYNCSDELEKTVHSESSPLIIVAKQNKPLSRDLASSYDSRHGWYNIALRNDNCGDYQESGNDRIERVSLSIDNPDDWPRTLRINFAKDGRVCSVTGLSAILCDQDMFPTGIPIQLSKNWHNSGYNHFNGPWYHGLTMLTIPPKQTVNLVYTSVNAHWGGVPAASHSQLSLIGWGSNQLWNQAAIGSWGESLCFEPDQGQLGGAVLDTRPLMVWAMSDSEPQRQWSWTNNVGGADFLVYYNTPFTKQWNSRMRTMYKRYGPNMTEVTYAGRSADSKINLKYTVTLYRTDDIIRGIYSFRYDVIETVNFDRLVLFQCGGDDYSYTGERKFARGNENGLIEEWTTQWGGDTYRTTPVELTGRIPWFSMHQAVPRSSQGAWANRGLVIRYWDAVLGGNKANPWAAERGARVRGSDTSLIDILPPTGITQLKPGDYVQCRIDHIVMPQHASDYYGPNANLKAALTKDENTWKMIYREAKGNDLDIAMTRGVLEHNYPIRIEARNGAEFSVTGGLGFVPVTFTGLCNYRPFTLQRKVDNNWIDVDQSFHGKDFWQTDFDPQNDRWEITYSLWLDQPNDARIPTEFRLVGPGFIPGDITCDEEVNMDDLQTLVLHWLEGQALCSCNQAGDINADSKVDLLDFEILAAHWLKDTE